MKPHVRIWSLHPQYLDARGLVALWREALLAQAVLGGRTSGYVHHPQLLRFRAHRSPPGAIALYLRAIHQESVRRGYRFAASRIGRAHGRGELIVTRGQLAFEWEHLMEKLRTRAPEWRRQWAAVRRPTAHPLFTIVPGGIAPWEKR